MKQIGRAPLPYLVTLPGLLLLAVIAVAGSGCDDDDMPMTNSGRDTRLEWPVDTGGFSTSDAGLPETGDAPDHDAAVAEAGELHDAP